MAKQAEILVAGGGIIGAAIADALVERDVRDVVVVDLEGPEGPGEPDLDATGVRATWWNEINIAACRDTILFFEEHAAVLSFRQDGCLRLYRDRERLRTAMERQKLQERLGWEVEILTPGEAERRFPHLDRGMDRVAGATLSPREGRVRPGAVRWLFRERAEAGGARFLDRHYVEGVETAEREPGLRRVEQVHVVEVAKGDPPGERGTLERILTTHSIPPEAVVERSSLRPEIVINALGAWSPILSSKLGLRDLAVPVRRRVSLLQVPGGALSRATDLGALGLVVDAGEVYYHAEGPLVLAGRPCSPEPSGYDLCHDGERFFRAEIHPRLEARSSVFERCVHLRGTAGIHSATPDSSGVVGRAAGFSNLLEAHGFRERGVMHCRALGRGVAELICGGAYETLDLSPFTGERFAGDPPASIVPELPS